MGKQVSISTNDAATAKEYKDKSSSTATTDALTTSLGAAVTVGSPPVTKMKLKTTVTSTKSKSELETALKSNDMVAKVGGASISSVSSSNEMETSSSGAFRSGMMTVISITLAVVAGSA